MCTICTIFLKFLSSRLSLELNQKTPKTKSWIFLELLPVVAVLWVPVDHNWSATTLNSVEPVFSTVSGLKEKRLHAWQPNLVWLHWATFLSNSKIKQLTNIVSFPFFLNQQAPYSIINPLLFLKKQWWRKEKVEAVGLKFKKQYKKADKHHDNDEDDETLRTTL